VQAYLDSAEREVTDEASRSCQVFAAFRIIWRFFVCCR